MLDEKDSPIVELVPVDRPRVASEDQSALFNTAKAVEIALGDDFMQALHRLDTAFKLPDASIHLSESLHLWREEVELLFPYRTGKSAPRKAPADSKNDPKDVMRMDTVSSEITGMRLIRRTRPHLGIRFVSKRGTLVDKQTWNSFCEACDALLMSFQSFSSAVHYLSDFQSTWCTIAVGEIMVTLAEMSVALRTGMEGDGHVHDAKKDTDLRNFIRLRLDVCQKQLLNFQDAIDEYKRNEISRVHSIQKRAFDGLSNVTQVSTFFAAVVASTLQFSLTADFSVPFIIINALWLSSLVLSIGSALNSFLGMKMRKVVSSTPLDKQPIYITFWIRKSYATLLVMSVFAYAVGLGVYVIKSQHTVVAIVTCVVGACCAVGIAIVCGNHLRERFSKWRKKRLATKSSSWNAPRISYPKEDASSLNEVKIYHHRGLTSRDTIVVDSEYHPAAALRQMSMHKSGQDDNANEADIHDEESDQSSDAYIALLKNVRKVVDSGTFDDFKRGKIAHMRCSANGRWVVVCHEHACIVYDAEDNMKHVTLLADDDKHSAEHAEWALEGSTLLTRTEKELRLWKIPNSILDYYKTNEYLSYEQRYILRDGHCKYIKWLNHRDFLLLSDTGTLYRVDCETGAKESNAFTQPETEGFQVTQVYPIDIGETDWVLCLATKTADLSESVVKAVGDGVDYFLILEKTAAENRSDDHLAHEFGNFFTGLYFSAFGTMKFGHVQQNAYVIRHRKILPRNIRNLKICKDHRYMLVNYDENELGTTAPELWALNFGPNYDLLSKTADGSIVALRPPIHKSETTSYQWGEASFAGPGHDVIVCEVDGVITFYRFDRDKGPSSLELIHPGMEAPDFGEFYHPIFTWGDTVSRPLMVATDLDGAGNLCIWSDSKPMKSS